MKRSNRYLSFAVILGTALATTGCIVVPNNNQGSNDSNNSYHPNKINLSSA